MTAPGDIAPAGLKLRAEDAEDIPALSALLQDAVVRLGDIVWEPRSRRLTLAVNRFRWETGASRRRVERVRAALQFGDVTSVRARRLRRGAADAIASLLSIRFEPAEVPPAGSVVFTFAGDADLRAEIDCVDAVLVDVSAPWPARGRPDHGPLA